MLHAVGGSVDAQQSSGDSATRAPRQISIWWFAFGYFAAYTPYSALAKAVSKGLIPGKPALSGFSMLPLSVAVSLVGMLTFLTVMGWWKHATHHRVLGMRLPGPTRWTLLSGLCTATIVATTTLAYTFSGVSIVFMMLLMRGGVLIIAPVVDRLTKRKVRWFSWAGLALSLGALVAAFTESSGYSLTFVAIVDVVAYLASYFVRLRFMSRLAKSESEDANYRYFVEEQMVATPAVLLVLAVLAVVDQGPMMHAIREGFVSVPGSALVWEVMVIGLLSQGTGIFGGLILLQRQENTFCVPVNRSSSIIAGVLASFMLTIFLGNKPPSVHQLVGAGLIIAAILFLTIPVMMQKRKKTSAPAKAEA